MVLVIMIIFLNPTDYSSKIIIILISKLFICCWSKSELLLVKMAGNRPQSTMEERVFMVVHYFENLNFAETVKQFRLHFHILGFQTEVQFWEMNKYLTQGTRLNRNRGHSRRPRSVRTQVNSDMVRQALQADPMMTARCNNIPISPLSFNRITRLDLSWYPYTMQRRNALQAGDFARRVQYCQWLTNWRWSNISYEWEC